MQTFVDWIIEKILWDLRAVYLLNVVNIWAASVLNGLFCTNYFFLQHIVRECFLEFPDTTNLSNNCVATYIGVKSALGFTISLYVRS